MFIRVGLLYIIEMSVSGANLSCEENESEIEVINYLTFHVVINFHKHCASFEANVLESSAQNMCLLFLRAGC